MKKLLAILALLMVASMLLVACTPEQTPEQDSTDEVTTEESGTTMIECSDCGAGGLCMTCYGHDEACEDCGGTFACASCEGSGYVESPSKFYNTGWALLPPIIAIALALITKEVYSSLFVGIGVGAAFACAGSPAVAMDHVINTGIIAAIFAVTLAYLGKSLITVAAGSAVVVLICELVIQWIG